MGLLVMFLYDLSDDQRRTRRQADGALDLTLKFLALARLAVLRPIRIRILSLLREAFYFQVTMTRGIFRFMQAEHLFRILPSGATEMRDIFSIAGPLKNRFLAGAARIQHWHVFVSIGGPQAHASPAV
jgi:hypothetical protein